MNNTVADPEIMKPTLESSEGITEMYWEQALSEHWCVTPLILVTPNVQMLTERGYVIPRNIYDDSPHPTNKRNTDRSHLCFIKFDRKYVIWWFWRQLQGLIDADNKLFFDIALECGIPEISTFLQEPSPDPQDPRQN